MRAGCICIHRCSVSHRLVISFKFMLDIFAHCFWLCARRKSSVKTMSVHFRYQHLVNRFPYFVAVLYSLIQSKHQKMGGGWCSTHSYINRVHSLLSLQDSYDRTVRRPPLGSSLLVLRVVGG
jgi:hypothetical protein